MPSPLEPALPSLPDPAHLLRTVLDVSQTGMLLLRPVLAATGELVDFSYEYLNPAARQQLHHGPQAAATLLAQYPPARTNGVFAFYRQAYQRGEPAQFSATFQDAYVDSYHQLSAQRSGELLVVSLLDMAGLLTANAQQALRESQAREQAIQAEAQAQRQGFSDLLSQAPGIVAIYTGPTHVIEVVSEGYRRLFGHRELLGRPYAEAVHEAGLQGGSLYAATAIYDQVYRTGQPFRASEAEFVADRTGTGQPELGYYDFIVQPTRDGRGRITGVQSYVYDVTAQVQARHQVEQLNRELEARVAERTRQLLAQELRQQADLTRLFEQAPVSIAVFRGPAHVIELSNERHLALWGRTRAQVLGQPIFEVLPEAAGQGFEELLAGVLATGQPHEAREQPVRLRRRGTVEEVTLNFTYQPLREPDGQVTGVISVAEDVTEQVQTRRQLEAQRRLLQQVFEQAPVAVYVMRMPDYTLEVVNERMAVLMGHPLAELVGRPISEALSELKGQGLDVRLHQVWATGQPAYLTELPVHLAHHGPGQQAYYNGVYQPIMNEQGQMTAMVCVAEDVTEAVLTRQRVQQLNEELRTANEELQASNAQLRRANADLDTFVYTASHDLKSPITNIEGLVLALQEVLPPAARLDPEASHLLHLLDGAARRARLIITQLTEVVRLQQAHAGPPEPVALGALVAEVCADLRAETEVAQGEVQFAIAPGLWVQFAPANLRSVVYNLLSNALKYRDPARPALVQVRAAPRPDGAVVLTVVDNGLGLSESQQQRLFQVFQRLHTHVEGTGVGLYLVKRLLDNAGAAIAVASTPGVGTSFTVTFPPPAPHQVAPQPA